MRITAISIYHVAMPLVYPFRTAYGDDAAIESVLVKMESGGVCGWGETSPLKLPFYSPEWAAGIFLLMRDVLAPRLLGQEIDTAEDLQWRLGPVKGNHFAKGGLDLAWWDLEARRTGRPLWKALGGVQPSVQVGADFGVMDSIDALLGKIDEAVRAGFPRVKLKFRRGWDLDMLAAVRRVFPKHTFHIDCNSSFTLADLDLFKKVDAFGLAMIEQPLAHDDLVDHAALQKHLATPLCLDESIVSVDRTRKAIQLKACGWMNVKPGRVGGLTTAVKIHDLCRDAGIPCWVGGMLESAVGARHCLALATLPNFKYPSDIFPSARFYKKDLADPDITMAGPGRIEAPAIAGVGADPNPEELVRLTVEHAVLEK
jgi:o-succinylbenzoate synthase